MNANPDGRYLENRRLDPTSTLSPVQQAMRIALYDEYRTEAVYQKVVDSFGQIAPFVNILKSEARHIAHLEALFAKYSVPLVVNDWSTRITISQSFVENCEIGVSAEIENISMYDNLLQYAEAPDVKELFYRLQAASYNHHLPAFRACVASCYANNTHQGNQEGGGEEFMKNMQELFGKIQSGRVDPSSLSQHLQPLLGGLTSDFIIGAVAGAALGVVIGGGLFGKES